MRGEIAAEFLTRRAEARDTGLLFELLSERFAASFPARFAWLYQANPEGAAATWLAVERSTGLLAGCTSVFPRRVMVSGKVHRGAVGGDCFVSQRFRRRGVATALHRATADGLADAGLEMVYGPPNPKNYQALIKSGSHAVGSFQSWMRPLTASPWPVPRLLGRASTAVLARMAGKLNPHFRMEPIDAGERGLPAFFDRVCGYYTVLPVRDLAYVRWRYLDSAANVQKPFVVKREGVIVGFVALERERARLHIIDFLTLGDKTVIDATLGLVVAHAEGLGCQAVYVETKAESVLSRRLGRRGFLPREARGFQVLGATGAELSAAVLEPESWHFLNGDEDLDTVAAP